MYYKIYIFKPTFIIHSIPQFNLHRMDAFTWLTPPGPYRATTCRERELTLDHIHTFLTTQGHEGLPGWEQLIAGATSETARTEKTIHTVHAPIYCNKANMKEWLWRPNDIWGPCGPKVSWHLFYRWGKTQKKTSSRKLVLTRNRSRARCVTVVHATTCSIGMN